MNLDWERFYPYLVGVIAALAWWAVAPEFHAEKSDVLSASLTVGAILTGFLATSKAIMLSMNDAPIMRELRESGYIKDLVSYLAQAILFSFFYAIVSLVGFFLNGSEAYWVIWTGAGVVAALTFVRVVWIQLRILSLEPRKK